MSKEIDLIFEKFNNVFTERQEEIKKYLLKYYKNSFVENEVLKVEKKDESAKIKTTGFHKNLSSWRNNYKNVIVSSCVEIKGERKRYDYKFYFTEERLNTETVEKIEAMIKDSNKFAKLFNFPEALSTVDSAIEMIRKKRDNFYESRLNKTRAKILQAEEDYNKIIENIERLEGEYSNIQGSKDPERIILLCEEIIKTSQIVKNQNIINKYKKIIESIKKKIEQKQTLENEIEDLELKLMQCRKVNKFEDALNICDQIVKIAIELENRGIEQKCRDIKIEIEKERDELGNMEAKIAQLEIDAKKYREEKAFGEALITCENIIILSKEVGNKDIEQKYIEVKKLIEKEQEEFGNFEEQIAQLVKLFDQYRKEKNFEQVLNTCEKIIDFSGKVEDKNRESNYTTIFNQIKKEFDEIRSTVNNLAAEGFEAYINKKIPESIVKYEEVISILRDYLK